MITPKNILLILFCSLQNFNCKPAATNLEPQNNLESKINKEAKIRYIEMYESICCPRDYKHDNNIISYIKFFENKHNVELLYRHKIILGREGEAAYFLSLEALSKTLQEQFINERLKMLKTDDKSVINYLENPIKINQALKLWEHQTINNLIKF